MIDLETPVSSLTMVGPTYSNRLKKLNIYTIKDLLYHLPFRYDDFSHVCKIAAVIPGITVTIVAKVVKFENVYTKTHKRIQKVTVADETGSIEVIWYNQPFLASLIRPGMLISLAGKVDWFGRKLVLISPVYETPRPNNAHPDTNSRQANLVHTGRLVGIYRETYGVSSKWLRSRIDALFRKIDVRLHEYLPRKILEKYALMDRDTAVRLVHFPANPEEAVAARQRLAFDELFELHLLSRIRKRSWEKRKSVFSFKKPEAVKKLIPFTEKLPFTLTNAQKRAVRDILSDLKGTHPMNRLLEGDVGSGKTVVAAIGMYFTFLHGYKSALMAPTEILANQHYATIDAMLSPFGVKVGLFTSSHKSAGREKLDVYIGTHALLTDLPQSNKLALVVIDEQQRFGVEQRSKLRSKSQYAHTLTMTATPIPRTIALTLYADLDLSVIDEMPTGREQVKTWVVPSEKREAAYEWIKKQITATVPYSQVFIVCPLIDPSDNLDDVKAVKKEYEYLQSKIFPEFTVGMLHGKLADTKKKIMIDDFRNGKADILLSTPVVEVGIDIPRATIMVIEGGERFGLAQLHQLRGRVGRGDRKSFCLIFTGSTDENSVNRLKLLEKYFSGPKLAEMDLKLRGPGDMYGTRQHGQLDLKIADLSDMPLLRKAKESADLIFESDPDMLDFPLLRELKQEYKMKQVLPD